MLIVIQMLTRCAQIAHKLCFTSSTAVIEGSMAEAALARKVQQANCPKETSTKVLRSLASEVGLLHSCLVRNDGC